MQATAKFSAIQPLFRRACTLVAPVFRYVAARRDEQPELEVWSPDCDAGDSPFRVTDSRRRWTRVRHFMDVGTALHHSLANDGVVWERYVGPTGAVNWWSLTEAECEAMLAAAPAPIEAAAATS
ncbi:MAG TPA: hypothetical protein VNT02_03100 [Burkholderiales bacterium]|nr:hypothetical protein [Burkholderiales bacterium]